MFLCFAMCTADGAALILVKKSLGIQLLTLNTERSHKRVYEMRPARSESGGQGRLTRFIAATQFHLPSYGSECPKCCRQFAAYLAASVASSITSRFS